MTQDNIEQLAVNTIRGLSVDAVLKANSGHQGMPMGMADIAVTVWSRFLKVDPDDPTWPDRDRFVLSNGHGSMLLYSLLHIAGFPLSLDDIRDFRQWGSHTAGHPEIDHELGIEMTTGPLGQGFGTGVGMAMAEAHLRARLGEDLVNHHTYGFVSDGDLMEGISSESASLAGHFGLGRLIYLYDDNQVTIDGTTDITFSENVEQRFGAINWHTVKVAGHDREEIAAAVGSALEETDRPSLIICKTRIGHGSPNFEGTPKVHGNPIGADEARLIKEGMGFPVDEDFYVPEGVYEFFNQAMNRGRQENAAWKTRVAASPEGWEALHNSDPIQLEDPGFETGEMLATRSATGKLFPQIAEVAPGLIGGSADLAGSTATVIEKGRLFSANDPGARDIAFGVREHAMGTIVNGMAIHGGLRPYGATFFVFSDYMRPAVRLSALMEIPSIWVWTHDSIFVGEDGPTHQPVEHLTSLRAMPGIWVIRPADAHEAQQAWELALNREDGPVALIFTRQTVPTLEPVSGGVARGGYVVRDGEDVTLIATGSEVSAALGAAEILATDGLGARVVSLPCWELFFEQDFEYREDVLGSAPRVSVEAAATFGWERIVGEGGLSIGIDRFGASAPDKVLAAQFGFTPEAIAARVRQYLES